MKLKRPKPFTFKIYYDMFSKKLPKVSVDSKGKSGRIIVSQETPQIAAKRKVLIDFMDKHQSMLEEFEKLTLDYVREIEFEYPKFYTHLSKAKSATKDRSYVNVQLFWPLKDGRKKDLRLYVEPYDGKSDIKDEWYQAMIQQKVAMRLKELRQDLEMLDDKENLKLK